MIRIIIVDDHQPYIDAIKTILEEESSIKIVGEALQGKELLEILERVSADVILMDIRMPLLDGIEATRQVKRKYPHIKVLMLTMQNKKRYITTMIAAGADGYILKNSGKDELVKAIHAVYTGNIYYSSAVTGQVMESFRKKKTSDSVQVVLTTREKEVLKLLFQDLTAIEIARVLKISPHTVDAHRKNMLSKLNVRTTVGLVKIAIEQRLLD